MKTTLKKSISAALAVLMVLSSFLIPLSAFAADTLSKAVNVVTESSNYNVSLYHGDDFINFEYENVNSDGVITVEENKPIVITMSDGEGYTASTYSTQSETLGWHYGTNSDSYCISTDSAFTMKDNGLGWTSFAVDGFGTARNQNSLKAQSGNSMKTTFTLQSGLSKGTYTFIVSYKFQMKQNSWGWKTRKEVSSTDTIKINVVEASVNPHIHTYDETVIAPTCTEKGYTEFICNNSDGYGTIGDDTYKANEVTALGHEYTGIVVSNNNGTHKQACVRFADCGDYSKDENCNYTYEIVTPATSTTTGLGRYTCTDCKYSYDETIATTACTHPNTEVRDAKDATCSSVGYTGDTWCRDCNTKIATGISIDKLAHTAGTATRENVVDATCKATGSYNEVVRCTKCNDVISSTPKTIEKLAHTAGTATRENVVNATCKAEGSYNEVVRCTKCNDVISSTAKTIEKLAHTAGTATRENVVNATCKAAGSYNEVVRCTKCNDVISSTAKTIEKLAHTAGTATRENVVDATCKAAGSYYEVVRCTKCNDVISSTAKTIDKLAHTPGKAVHENVVNATCVTAGSYDEITYCSVCNAVIKTEKVTGSVDSDNHVGDTEIRNAVKSTVTEYGYTGDTYCKSCNKIVAQGERINKLAPEMIKGQKSEWIKESDTALSFTSNASVDDFVKVLINGKELSADNYVVSSGSTVVELKSSYLNTLSAGVYTIDIVSLNGIASADFTIKAANVPATEPTTGEPVTDEPSTEPTKPAEAESTTKPTTEPSTDKTTTADDTTSSTTTTAKADKTEKTTNKTVAEKNTSKTSPNTGADDYVLFVSLMCAFAGCAVMFAVVKKRKIVTDK